MNHGNNVIPYFAQRFTFGLLDTAALRLYNNDNLVANGYYGDHIMYYSVAAGLRLGEKRVKWFTEASYSTTIRHFYNTSSRGKRETINLQLTVGMMIGLR